MSNCYAIEDLIPVVDPTAYVHPTAVLIGDVIIALRAVQPDRPRFCGGSSLTLGTTKALMKR